MAYVCEGNIALLRFQEDIKRRLPYLKRNLRKSLDYLVMGSSISRGNGTEVDQRPPKRRKVSSASNPASELGYSARFEREEPNLEFLQALRIDLLKITANKVEVVPEEEVSVPIVIRLRASIGIFYANSEDQSNKGRPTDYPELCRKTSTAKMRISKTADGKQINREIEMQPIVFSCDELFVNRKKTFLREPTEFDEPGYQTYELADQYRLQVTLERLGPEDVWPPVENNDWTTMSEEYFARYSNSSCLEVKTLLPMSVAQQRKAPAIWVVHRSTKQIVPYNLHLQTQWSKPNSIPRAPPRQEIPRRPLGDISDQTLLQQTMDNDTGERRSRKRKLVHYNLKRLSDEAVGKTSPQKRKRKSETESITGDEMADDITVAFSFGPADSAEVGIPRQHNFKSLRCPFCDRNHSTFDQYRFHLHNDHDNFKFSLRRQNPSRYSFFVEVVASNSGNRILKRTFQLGKPVTLFNLEKYLNGDNSWVTARQGPMHNHWPDKFTSGSGIAADSPFTSASPGPSHRSSPNTSSRSNEDISRNIEDAMDLDVVNKGLAKLCTRTRKIVLVPKTAKPLFHTITKRQLEPGEELPSSEDEKDESWFLQKHRDMLNDFEDSDVSPSEKEYLNQWNTYATNHHHNVDVLIPNTIDGFISEHTSDGWFLIPPRTQKFMAHMNVLMLQGVVTERQVSKWVGILREAKENSRQEDVDMEQSQEEQAVPKLRGNHDCICLEHVPLSPNRLMCVGKTCKNRFFHRACVSNLLSVPKGKWKCEDCMDSASLFAYS